MKQLWQTMQETGDLIGQRTVPAVMAAIERVGMSGKPLGMLLHTYDYGILTAEKLVCCVPYYHPKVFQERLDVLERDGMIRLSDEGYYLTETGLNAIETIVRASFESVADLHPLPAASLQRLANDLERILVAAKHHPDVELCILTKTAPDITLNESSLGWIAEYISHLTMYRCDCHVAAWKTTGVSGFSWEPFTWLWRGEADSLETLVERAGKERMSRGHDDYGVFVKELIDRGWIEADGATLRLTAAGQEVRDEAEKRTDTLFYAAWNALTRDELNGLGTLLNELKEKLA